MRVRKSPVNLNIDQVESICRGLSLLPDKTLDERRLHGEMCQLRDVMYQLEPIT